MNKKLLAIAGVLALIAAIMLPLGIGAEEGSTDIGGTLGASASVTAPSEITFSTFATGSNTANSTTPGEITVSNAADWTIDVTTNNMVSTDSFMKNATPTNLTNAITFSTTAGSYGNIAAYESALITLWSTDYGTNTTVSVPLYVSQTVASGDPSGSYSITVTFTVTPS